MDRKLARQAHLDELPLRARRGRAGCANTYTTLVYDEGTKDLLAAFSACRLRPRREEAEQLRSLVTFVERGGELLMVGAYMTFSGFEVRALRADAARCYVACGDCRSRRPHRRAGRHQSGRRKRSRRPKGIPPNWPYFLGYGPVGAFASDCSPHWGSLESLAWLTIQNSSPSRRDDLPAGEGL